MDTLNVQPIVAKMKTKVLVKVMWLDGSPFVQPDPSETLLSSPHYKNLLG